MNITLTSIQAPNQDRIPAALADYLEKKLSIPTRFIHEPAWQERERLLDAGQIDIGWICGLPYIKKVDQPAARIELLAAPVRSAPRYQDRPIYFSDVIVQRDSRFRSFEELRGGRWAFNEPNSHSGYNLTRYMLAQMGEDRGYFSSVAQAGSHQAALEMLLDGQIDATAIDSTVLEAELEDRPALAGQIRTLVAWGPSPIPPWVIQQELPKDLKNAVRETLVGMAADLEGRQVLTKLGLKRFARVSDGDYDPIREMARIAQPVQL